MPEPHVKQECGQPHLPANFQVAVHQQELCIAAGQLWCQRWRVLRHVTIAQPDSAVTL